MYNLRIYIKGPGVVKTKEPIKKNKESGGSNPKETPVKTKIFNTLSYRHVAKNNIRELLGRVEAMQNVEIIKHEIRLEK
jgi:hypothetical protein